MKKYMVRSDIEGVSGVVSFAQTEPGQLEYPFGQRMLMADLLALLEGLGAAGADEVIIYDEHYYARNIDIAELPPFASAICGKPAYRCDWPGGLDDTFTGVILLGFHSKFGTSGGLLHHSYEPDTRDLRLNGLSVGEIGMEAAIAGDLGVPVVLVTGDSAGIAEAKALLPGVRCAVVKQSLSETAGQCPALSVSTQTIRTAAEEVVKHPPEVAPLRISPPVKLEVELNDGALLESVRRHLANDLTNDRTLAFEGVGVLEVWAEYWEKKTRRQAAIEESQSTGASEV